MIQSRYAGHVDVWCGNEVRIVETYEVNLGCCAFHCEVVRLREICGFAFTDGQSSSQMQFFYTYLTNVDPVTPGDVREITEA